MRKRRFLLGWAVGLLLAAICFPVLATAADEGKGPPAGKERTEMPRLRSFWFAGTSNYHIRLEESEQEVDSMLNDTVGRLLPRWTDPTTFKDWSREGRIWDLWVGYGRDLSPRFSWSVYAGGGVGTIVNRERYLPLKTLVMDADFTRKSFLLGASVSFYPLGRPMYQGAGIRNTLRGLRPMAELNVGYTNQTSLAEVRARLPLVGNVVRIRMEDHYHLFWGSPRFGFEAPLSERDSINFLVGYLFFTDHAPEYNGYMFEIFYRRRF